MKIWARERWLSGSPNALWLTAAASSNLRQTCVLLASLNCNKQCPCYTCLFKQNHNCFVQVKLLSEVVVSLINKWMANIHGISHNLTLIYLLVAQLKALPLARGFVAGNDCGLSIDAIHCCDHWAVPLQHKLHQVKPDFRTWGKSTPA